MNTRMGLNFPRIVTTKLKRKIQRQIKTILVFGLIFTTAFNGLIIPPNFANAALVPNGAVGPVTATIGFPAWYKDQNGLTLDLMEAADTFGISAAVEAGNAFSEQIGFGAEGFWWSADASIDTGAVSARLVLALEAAFGGESAVDGEQSAFGRVRFVIDGLTPNASYTISYPYGTVVETADEFGSIFVTDDIGCFAVAGSISCDPNSPLGNPLPQFNFGKALSSNIGPFLVWDTFNIDPLLTDANLVNPDPAYADRQYVGNPNIEHAIIGSPANQNYFRIEGANVGGVGINSIETNLFTVTGRLAQAVAPVIDPIANKTAVINTPITFQANATDVNLDAISYSVTPVTAIGNEADATIDPITGTFIWTPNTAGTATFTVGASDGTTVSTTLVTIEVTDVAPTAASIAVTPNAASVVAGATRQLSAVALDLNGAQIVPTPAITWSSSDDTKATVNPATGLVTAVAAGTATITATAGIVSGSAVITVTPLVLVGGGLSASIPVEPVSKFPKWYKDRTGLALELMEAADAFGISAPVDGVGTFSETIGFGAEGFWSSADAVMITTGNKPAVLVQAVEAAFAGEVAVDGQQSAFGRIRIRVDVNEPGTYVVTYPYGQKTYTVDTIDAGYEINDTSDIGCFAVQGISSCDPNAINGTPQAGFNFNAVGFSEVGPFLSWDTFDPISNDPALINPANPTRKYVGNAAVAHAIKGSPTGNNFFRIESATPGVDLDPTIAGAQSSIQTNLFNVSGRLADVTAPIITVLGANPDSVLQGGVYADPGAMALDDFDGNVTAKITATPVNTAIAGPQTITYTVADVAGNIATASRTVNVLAQPVVTNTVVIEAAAPIIAADGTLQLSVAVVDVNGSAVVPAPAVALESATPAVATIDANGLVTAVATGTTIITATAQGLPIATTSITVTEPVADPVVTAVNVATAVSTIPVGVSQQLSVAVIDENGVAIATPPVITLASDVPAVATVDQATGVVTAVASGTAVITLTSGAQTDTQVINVISAPIQDTSIVKNGELSNGMASFVWSSENGIGTQNGSTPAGSNYTYYDDGAYLRFQVKDTNNLAVKFADVFESVDAINNAVGGMTLQTNSGAINDMDGSNREKSDWGVAGFEAYATNLPNTGNYVFYGLIQSAPVGTKTVGFPSGTARLVKMTLSPKAGLTPGIYTVTVEALQQGSEDVKGLITYTFEVVDMTAYNAALSAAVQADYTPASWSAYQAVVMANVMTTANTQAEIDAATLAITTAQGNLVTLVAQEAINQATAETAVSAYEAGPISTLAEIAVAEGLKDAADAAVLAVGDVTAKTAFDLRVSAREAAIASARAELEAAALEATAQAAAETAVVAYESGPITTLAEVTIAEGLKAAADTAVSAVGDATVKSAFEQRVATRAIEIGTAKTSLEAAAAAEAAAAQAAAAEAAAQASAETAVAAYEAGPLTSLVEVASAEGLKASADTAVSAVGNAAAKSAFELRISIRSAAIVTAKMALTTASGSNSGTSGGVSGGSVPVWMLQQTNPTTVPQGSAVETPVQNVEDKEEGLDNSGKNLTEVQAPIQKVLGVKVYPEGSLIRTVDKKIYVIKNGMNVLIKNLIELKQYAGQKIIDIKDAISGLQAYSEGSLVRTPDKKIYVIKNGEKVLIKNLIELRQYAGMKITDISGLQAYSEGSLVRTPDKKIYVIKNGEKVLIKNLIELRQYAGMKIVDVPMAQ